MSSPVSQMVSLTRERSPIQSSSRSPDNAHARAQSSSSNTAHSINTHTNNVSHLRPVRQYHNTSKSPFTVYIRELDHKLSPTKLSTYIYDKYPSTFKVKASQGKIRVVLQSWKEANSLTIDSALDAYHITIPADDVEIEGAVEWNDLCDLQDMNLLCHKGIGGFNNQSIPDCKIVHAVSPCQRFITIIICESCF